MSEEGFLIVTGFLISFIGILMLILRLRKKEANNQIRFRQGFAEDPFGKSAKIQMLILAISLILAGLILIFRNIT